MAVTIATRPTTIDGCWASWEEKQQSNVIRTEMDQTGSVKVRRRSTGVSRIANVSRNLTAEQYDDFVQWFNVSCQGGVLPTRVVTPYKKEEIWRFTEPPQITWLDSKAFAVSCTIEQIPVWKGL